MAPECHCEHTQRRPYTERRHRGAVEVPSDFLTREAVVLNLHTPDFTTSSRLAGTDQFETMGPGTAQSTRCCIGRSAGAPGCLSSAPPSYRRLKTSRLSQARRPAKVIVNSRTGTVVIGDERYA